MEVQNQTNPWNIVGFILGLAAGFTLVLAPIHEMGHVISAFLVLAKARMDAWNHCELWVRWEWQNIFISAMGHGFEVLFAGFLASRIKKQPFTVFAGTWSIGAAISFVYDGITVDYSDLATSPLSIIPFTIVFILTWKFFILRAKPEKSDSRSEKFAKNPRTI